MNYEEAYEDIQNVLKRFHDGNSPIKANIAAQIIFEIQQRTGDETFVCNPVELKL